MNEENQENDDINIADFLKSNSELFVVLGVFSALAIYISDLGGDSLGNAPSEIRIGFGGSLLLSILLIIIIYKQLVEKVGSIEDLFRAHTEYQNWDLIVFTGGIILLLPSLITPILQELIALYYVIGVLTILGLIAVTFRIMLRIEHILPENDIQRNVILIIISGICIYFARKYLDYLELNPEVYGPGTFSTSNLSPVLYDSLAVIAFAILSVSLGLSIFAGLNLASNLGEEYVRTGDS